MSTTVKVIIVAALFLGLYALIYFKISLPGSEFLGTWKLTSELITIERDGKDFTLVSWYADGWRKSPTYRAVLKDGFLETQTKDGKQISLLTYNPSGLEPLGITGTLSCNANFREGRYERERSMSPLRWLLILHITLLAVAGLFVWRIIKRLNIRRSP